MLGIGCARFSTIRESPDAEEIQRSDSPDAESLQRSEVPDAPPDHFVIHPSGAESLSFWK
jgi:hypothetical protein